MLLCQARLLEFYYYFYTTTTLLLLETVELDSTNIQFYQYDTTIIIKLVTCLLPLVLFIYFKY